MKKYLPLLLILSFYSLATHAACPSWPTANRFILNGAEVSDKHTDLVRRRCSEGQSWDGSTCTGSATYTHHYAVLGLAKAANSSDSPTGWRLPSVRELGSLADRGCWNPAIDSTAFPATPSDHFWTSTPYPIESMFAWGIYFDDGYVHHAHYLYHEGYTRLVRSSQ